MEKTSKPKLKYKGAIDAVAPSKHQCGDAARIHPFQNCNCQHGLPVVPPLLLVTPKHYQDMMAPNLASRAIQRAYLNAKSAGLHKHSHLQPARYQRLGAFNNSAGNFKCRMTAWSMSTTGIYVATHTK